MCTHQQAVLCRDRTPLFCGGDGSPAGRRARDGSACQGTMHAWSLISGLGSRHSNTRAPPPWAIGGSTAVPGSGISSILIPLHSSVRPTGAPGLSPMPLTDIHGGSRLPREHGRTQMPLGLPRQVQLCRWVCLLPFPFSTTLL